jgi:hypothetical protein
MSPSRSQWRCSSAKQGYGREQALCFEQALTGFTALIARNGLQYESWPQRVTRGGFRGGPEVHARDVRRPTFEAAAPAPFPPHPMSPEIADWRPLRNIGRRNSLLFGAHFLLLETSKSSRRRSHFTSLMKVGNPSSASEHRKALMGWKFVLASSIDCFGLLETL